MFVAVDGKIAGLVGVADPIKSTTPEAIRGLHEDKIRLVMMTGDSRTTAEAVAKKLNIDEIAAEVLPNQKAEPVKRFFKPRDALSRWPETASTMLPHWPKPKLESQWERKRMSQ